MIIIASIAGAACLGLGYVAFGGGIALGVALLTLLFWFLAYKRPSHCPPLAVLVLSLGLAGGGLFAGGSSWLMLFGATLSLASWDLIRLAHALADCTNSSTRTLAEYQNTHYVGLALALGLSLLITLAGHLVPLQIPFAGVILLVILALLAFDRAWRVLSRS